MMTNNYPLISFIVPVYNVENYLSQCVDSIITQKESNFELILVDDGSTDNSGLICDEYKEKCNKIKVVHKDNGGLVSARKAGLLLADGDYIACIDGDDWIENDYLTKINNIFKNSNPDIIAFNFRKIGKAKNKKMLYFSNETYNDEKIKKEIFPCLIQDKNGKYFSPSLINKIIKKDIYKESQNNVSDKISVGEDFVCLITCIINAHSIVSIEDCLYCYRQNNDSLTKSKKPFDWKYPETMLNGIKNSIMNNELFCEQIDRKIVHELYSVVFSQFYSNETYRNIVLNINNILEYDMYKSALINAKFDSFIFSIIQLLLRKRVIFPFKVVSIIKELIFRYEL